MVSRIRKLRSRKELVQMLETQGRLLVQLAVGVQAASLSGVDLHKTPAGGELMKQAAEVRKMAGLQT